MATEKLKFKLELYSTMWDKPPYAEILIDHDVQFKGAITGTENKPNVIEFEYEMKSEQQSLKRLQRQRQLKSIQEDYQTQEQRILDFRMKKHFEKKQEIYLKVQIKSGFV